MNPMPRKSEDMTSKYLHEFNPSNFLQNMATILEPSDSEPPILAQPVRQAVFQWLAELNAQEELESVGLKPRRKLMFYGAPGCGKTTLAHHLAARIGIPLVLINMQAIVSCYVGATGNNIDAIFRELREKSDDCIVFLDEFDSIAEKRQPARGGADKERNNIVIAIMQKMDAYEGTLIAATNRKDDIDAAIWRRFQMHVDIAEPDSECRFAIIKRYLAPFALNDEGLEILTNATSGATPALLRQLSESIKRDMVLHQRLKYSSDAVSVFARAVASAVPHSEASLPPLWDNTKRIATELAKHWPPTKL